MYNHINIQICLKICRIKLLFILACPSTVQAQCLSGDCTNGVGKYDFGYATYYGRFKNGEPHGSGTMDYGGGEKYMGEFTEGKEDGKGLLYRKNGSYEVVTYKEGILQTAEKIIYVGGNIVVNGCAAGDCQNQHSTLLLPNGDKYTGEFSKFKPHGEGRYEFASGNVATGKFSDGQLVSGTFYYEGGESFTGTFNPNGTPKTGKYKLNAEGDEVSIKDNTITTVRNIVEEKEKIAAKERASMSTCRGCNGSGGDLVQMTWKSSKKTYNGTLYDEYEITTHTGPSYFSACFVCHGSGKIKQK